MERRTRQPRGDQRTPGPRRVDGDPKPVDLACALLALLTVSCTAMIYASLKPIQRWRNRFVLPAYLALGLYSGSLLLALVTRLFGLDWPGFALLAAVLLGVAWGMRMGLLRAV